MNDIGKRHDVLMTYFLLFSFSSFYIANPEEVKPGRKAPPGGVPLFGAGVATEDELFGGSPKLSQEGVSS